MAALARARGYDVLAVDLRAESDGLALDLRDAEAAASLVRRARPDVVIHLAGVLRAEDPAALYATHVLATVSMLEALAAERPGARVVLVSSSAVYGQRGDRAAVPEDAPLRPIHHYGASKAAQELAAFAVAATGNLEILVARPFNVIGPGQPPSLAASNFARQIAAAERGQAPAVVRVGDLSAIRDFVDVRDVARAYLDLAERGEPGQTYNVCTGKGVSIGACLDELLALARIPIRVERNNTEPRAREIRTQVGDPTRLRERTGWSPQVPLSRSLADLLESWRMQRTEASEPT